MLNQVVLVGKIEKIGKLKQDEQGRNNVNITLSIPRNYKNENGKYETDLVKCELPGMIAKNSDYLNLGDIVGIKGYVKNDKKSIKILAERVTFLSNTRKKEEMER